MSHGIRRFWPLLPLVLLSGCATTIPNGAIRGTVRLAAPPPPATAPGVPAPDPDQVTDVVVYVESLPAASGSSRPARSPATQTSARTPGVTPVARPASASTRQKPATRLGPPGVPAPKPAPPRKTRAPGAAELRDPPSATVAQRDHRFIPRVLPVAAGTTVSFENRDQIYQNVFSVSPVKRFDVGKFAPGQTRRVTFDKPGVVKLFCDIDPLMAGFVFVAPTPVFAKPDASGAFVLPDLPRGAYMLRVWHPTLGEKTREVEIPPEGDAVVELRL